MANHMTSRYGGQQGSFAESLAAFAEQAKEAIDDVFRDVVIEIGTSIIRLSPVDTGRFKGNWHLSIDNIESVTFDEVDPTGAKVRTTGTKRATITARPPKRSKNAFVR